MNERKKKPERNDEGVSFVDHTREHAHARACACSLAVLAT